MTSGLSIAGATHRFAYDGAPTLDDVTLHVSPGECVALLGPSGSGKTTLLRAVAGLARLQSGRVRHDGEDLTGVAPEARGMSMVFQRPLLFPHLSVMDNVAFPGRVRGASRRTARVDAQRFLELVGMEGFAGRDVRALSGGQQQRVALARALAARPRVLLLDEPFAALDASTRDNVHELLLELRTVLEPSVLLVTHDHEEASTLADSIAVLVGGRLVQHAPVGLIYRQPVDVGVYRLLGGLTEIPGVVHDGQHHSTALGWLDLPPECGVGDGAATLLVRHEQVRLTAAADPDATVTATVESVRRRGTRQRITLDAAGERLVADDCAPESAGPGDVVGLVVPSGALWAVSGVASGSPEQSGVPTGLPLGTAVNP